MGAAPSKCCCLSQPPQSGPPVQSFGQQRQPHPSYPTPQTQLQQEPNYQNFPPYKPCASRYPEPVARSSFGFIVFTTFVIIAIFSCVYVYYNYVLPMRDAIGQVTRSLNQAHSGVINLPRSFPGGFPPMHEPLEDDEYEDHGGIDEDTSTDYISPLNHSRRNGPSVSSHRMRREVRMRHPAEQQVRCTRVSIDPSARAENSSENLAGHGSRNNSLDGVSRLKTKNAST